MSGALLHMWPPIYNALTLSLFVHCCDLGLNMGVGLGTWVKFVSAASTFFLDIYLDFSRSHDSSAIRCTYKDVSCLVSLNYWCALSVPGSRQ